jgi:ribosome-binding ATPase YchF (GTP1/OBG family)
VKIGLVGYQGSGKSTLFAWLTGVPADPAQAHGGQSAMASIPDPRVDKLAEVYRPKKVHLASLEIVDTPGLSRTHEGNAQRLAILREAGCLVLVAAAFDGSSPAADIRSFDEDLMLADMEVLGSRIERIEQALKKPLPRQEHQNLEHEHETLKMVLGAIESGSPLREAHLTDEQAKVTRAFRLLSEKPRLVVVNTADDEERPERFTSLSTGEVPVLAVPAGLEWELSRMSPEERKEFEEEMGAGGTDRDAIIRKLLDVSGQMTFYTCGDKEVRTWLLPRESTALEAADSIHSDLARGFIRAEVIKADDLLRLGSEREVKAHGLMRPEPKDYVVQDDDIVFIRFSV